MTATAIPSASLVTAVSNEFTISLTTAVSEPVHWNSVPSIALASSIPYWVGTKNGLVVT